MCYSELKTFAEWTTLFGFYYFMKGFFCESISKQAHSTRRDKLSKLCIIKACFLVYGFTTFYGTHH